MTIESVASLLCALLTKHKIHFTFRNNTDSCITVTGELMPVALLNLLRSSLIILGIEVYDHPASAEFFKDGSVELIVVQGSQGSALVGFNYNKVMYNDS
jgi:hypothetical protein